MPARFPRAAHTRAVVPRYITSPIWGPWSARNGGTSMSVVLGPNANLSINYGSTPRADTPSVMIALKAQSPNFHWKAGHLLNDNLGGPGTANNLTPMTVTCNRQFATFEGQIRRAIDRANLYHRQNPTARFYYGVRFEVATFGQFNRVPQPCPAGIVFSAYAVQQDKATRLITDAPTINRLHFRRITNRQIRNA